MINMYIVNYRGAIGVKTIRKTSKQGGKVLLLIDWDNLFINLFRELRPEDVRFEERIKKMIEWVHSEVGDLIGGQGFVFAHEHITYLDQQTCSKNNLKLMICPKEKMKDREKEIDTVDENIIWFAKLMSDHPLIRYICLVSGDSDYMEMLEEMKKKGLKIALAIPTLSSFSRLNKIALLPDLNHKKEKMIFLIEKAL